MSDMIGQQIENYRIDAVLGEGGMGVVYRAWDLNLARQVAVKVMHAQFASQAEFRQRFLQEAQAPARLVHPSIVQIYQLGTQSGRLYIVMEFVPGTTLSAFLRLASQKSGVIDLKESLLILAQVADALDYAHRRGVIHRDIKPDNILLRQLDKPDREGDPPIRAEVTDFGLAKLLEGGVHTQTGSFLGTLPYMSPEQCLGKSLDARTDIYSLGVVLYRLLTGRLPLDIQSPTDAILKHMHEVVTPPRQVRPGVPASLEAIVLKAIAKEPSDRYETAAALYTDLRQAGNRLSQQDVSLFAPPETVISILTQPQEADSSGQGRAILDQFPPTPSDLEVDRVQILITGQTIRAVQISPAGLTFGREGDNDISLDDPQVSRHHARLSVEEGNYWITDLNSTNGSFLGGARLLPGVRELWMPDVPLRLGDCWLRLELASGKPRTGKPGIQEERPKATVAMTTTSVGGRVGVYLDQLSFTAKPGEKLVIPILILNQGPVVDHFQVSADGIPQKWLVEVPTPLQLLPAEQGQVRLAIQPELQTSHAGEYTMTLIVSSRVAPDEIARVQTTLSVSAEYRFQLELQPQKQRGLRQAAFNLLAQNDSNAPITLVLDPKDPEACCQFDFDQAQLKVPPGKKAQTRLVVRSDRSLVEWSPRLHSFIVTARLAEHPEQSTQVSGTFEQTPPVLDLSLRPQRVRSTAPASFNLFLNSSGGDAFSVHMEGLDPEDICSYTFSSQRVELKDGERTILVKVYPKNPQVLERQEIVRFSLSAEIEDAPGLVRQVQGEWEPVSPQVDLSLEPPTVYGKSASNFQVRVANRSLVELPMQLEASCKLSGCTLRFDSNQYRIPPGEIWLAKLAVEAGELWKGPGSKSWPILVSARLQESSLVAGQVEGTWMQQPVAPPAPAPKPAAGPSGIPEAVPSGFGFKPDLPEAVRETRKKPQVFQGCLLLVIGLVVTAIAGFVLGTLAENNIDIDAGLPCASVVWLIGLVLTLRSAIRSWRGQ